MTSLRLAAVLASIVAVLALAAPVAAASGAAGSVAVSGRQEAAQGGSCDGATFVMSGDLEGCWTTDSFDLRAIGGSGVVVGSGTETFTGCIGSRCGSLSFTFTFIGRFDANGAELWGGCHHPIRSGTGDFEGAIGTLNFIDLADGSGLPPADYTGHIVFRR